MLLPAAASVVGHERYLRVLRAEYERGGTVAALPDPSATPIGVFTDTARGSGSRR
jgi:hypothetical protein